MTKQEIDQHLEDHQDILNADHTAETFDLCELYTAVRPVLVLVAHSGLLKILKPKWSAAIQKYIDAQDVKCPQ